MAGAGKRRQATWRGLRAGVCLGTRGEKAQWEMEPLTFPLFLGILKYACYAGVFLLKTGGSQQASFVMMFFV